MPQVEVPVTHPTAFIIHMEGDQQIVLDMKDNRCAAESFAATVAAAVKVAAIVTVVVIVTMAVSVTATVTGLSGRHSKQVSLSKIRTQNLKVYAKLSVGHESLSSTCHCTAVSHCEQCCLCLPAVSGLETLP